ncbi:MMPL family transporter [Spongisporangium articulatum]|uniref:MMPL family transporter n=1 Tax=Spongisporangium articulatum TaxID=3362603 RepID=A0ABW8AVJ3_9ACTN
MVDRILHLLTGRRSAWLVLILAVAASAAVIGLGGQLQVDDDPAAGVPTSSQSADVARLQAQLPGARQNPALVVYSRPGAGLDEADLAAVTEQRSALARLAEGGQVSPPQVAPDRTVALVAVPLPAAADVEDTAASVRQLRETVRAGLPAGLTAQVSGAAGFQADIASAFDGADLRLLGATAAVVALLLLVTYRSPFLWLVPLIVVGVADQVAGALLKILSRHSDLRIDQSITGIVAVLVFGAGTDYALLLIARYREELRRRPDRREAMRAAVGSAGPAVLASGVTVVLALLTLLLAALKFDVAIGAAGAIGIAVALVYGLLVLPAALVVCPRGVFWPLVPRADESGRRANEREGRGWRRIGTWTARRPWPVALTSIVVLGALATGVLSTSYGLSQADGFRTAAESVDGLRTLAKAFPAGSVEPLAVITRPDRVDDVVTAARQVEGVAQVRPGDRSASLAQVDVVLSAAPDTPASYQAVRDLRTALAAVPGADAKVGGGVATNLDARDAAVRDLKLIAPLVLLVVFLVLLVLLRSLVAPLVLIVTVVLSYFAALGGASLLFSQVLDYPGLDFQVPLLSFLFLVALGVDYNIFLSTRAREEAARVGTRRGVVDALAVTGGVITSAGILLAAVFTVLGVLPVTVLTELGVIVGLGVLLDTLLVRTVVVPALVEILGERFWWPGRAVGVSTRTSPGT